MRKLWRSLVYFAVVGLLSNLLGACIPRRFRTDVFPFRPYAFERGGRFYDRFRIRKWKSKVPDMSRYLHALPRKALTDPSCEQVELLVQETCVAEIIHTALILLSLPVFFHEPDLESALIVIVYAAGNVPFIMIQRYNRPRLLRLAARLERTDAVEREEPVHGKVGAV